MRHVVTYDISKWRCIHASYCDVQPYNWLEKFINLITVIFDMWHQICCHLEVNSCITSEFHNLTKLKTCLCITVLLFWYTYFNVYTSYPWRLHTLYKSSCVSPDLILGNLYGVLTGEISHSISRFEPVSSLSPSDGRPLGLGGLKL